MHRVAVSPPFTRVRQSVHSNIPSTALVNSGQTETRQIFFRRNLLKKTKVTWLLHRYLCLTQRDRKPHESLPTIPTVAEEEGMETHT